MADSLDGCGDDPAWLNDAYISLILNAYTDNQLAAIKEYSAKLATDKGENYSSYIHLLQAAYTTQDDEEDVKRVSFIVKSRLNDELMSQIEEHFNVFHREAQAYKVIMKAGEQLLRQIDDDSRFGPRAIYVDDSIIVQENLKEQGFRIEDVKQGFSYEQIRLVLVKLAKFHAVSMVLYKKNPDMFRHHLPGNVSEHPTPLHDLYINAIHTCVEYCNSNPELQEYAMKLASFGEKIIPKMMNVFSRNQADRFHVLNHGDMWVNNLMFRKNEEGDLQEVLFVDYQEGFYGSPGIDWNYFIFSSWQKDVFVEHFDDLLAVYHSTLSEILQNLGYSQRIPTVEDVRREIVNKAFHGLSTATCLLPILINEHPDLTDPVNFLLDTETAIQNRHTVFNNPKFGERLKVFLQFFRDNNVL